MLAYGQEKDLHLAICMSPGKPTLATLLLVFSCCFLSMFLLKGCSKTFQKEKTYIVAYDPTWFPLEVSQAIHQISAFSQNLLVKIGDQQELRFRARESQWDSMRRRIHIDEYQAMLTGLTPSHANQGRYVFSEPYLHLGQVLLVPEEASITKIEDIQNSVIGAARNRPRDLSYIPSPTTPVYLYDSSQEATEQMLSGRVTAVIMNGMRANAYVRGLYKGKVKVAQHLSDESLRLVVLKGGDYGFLIEEFNKGLEALRQENSYTELLEKWELLNL